MKLKTKKSCQGGGSWRPSKMILTLYNLEWSTSFMIDLVMTKENWNVI